jgi:predicted DNA-binding transcriptional regulator AlpA
VSPDLLTGLRALAAALPAGTPIPVPAEVLLELCANGSAAPVAAPTERMLAAEEVAKLLGTTERWVYSHAEQLGGKRFSRRCLRFPEPTVRRCMERRQ